MKEEWEKVKLGEFFTVKKGQAITKKDSNEGPYPVILGGREPAYYIDRYNHTGKAIVVSRSGASAGFVSFWNEPIFITDGFLIEPKNDVCYEFVYHLMKNKQKQFIGSQKGAAIPHVTPALLSDVDVLRPPLPTQQKIASILSAYDDLIENNRKQIKLLEEAAQKLYKEWFVKLNFPGHENTKIVDGIPEEWKKGTLNDFGKIITGKTPSTKNENYYGGDIPFVKIPDMHKGIFTIKTEEYLTIEGANTQKNKFIPSESLIVSCIGTAGLVNIAYEECQTNQQINSIVCTKKENVYYLYYFLKSQKEYLNALGSNGATMVNVNKEKFGNVEVLIPNDKILERFAVITKPYFDKIMNCQLSIFNSQSARDKLLPKFMNGEIYV